MMRLKKLGAALVVVAAFGAVLASNAFAAAVTEDVHWYTNTQNPLTESVAMGAEAVGAGTFDTEAEGGATYLLEFKKVSCIECKIENIGGVAVGSGKLKFTEVSVVEPAGCEVAKEITTTALSVTADWMIGTKNYIKFTPTKGETTAFASVSITGCALETSLIPKGNLFVRTVSPTETLKEKQEVESSAAINTEAGGSLKVGSKPAILTAKAKLFMTGAGHGTEFGTKK